MFILVAAVILLISFVIALISLIREQKKLNKIAAAGEHKEPVEVNSPEPVEKVEVQNVSNTPTTEPEIKTEPGVVAEPKEVAAHEPFPWEAQAQTDTVDTASDNTMPETQAVKLQEESFTLSPRRAGTGLSVKADDLRGTVSLKDLADKK